MACGLPHMSSNSAVTKLYEACLESSHLFALVPSKTDARAQRLICAGLDLHASVRGSLPLCHASGFQP